MEPLPDHTVATYRALKANGYLDTYVVYKIHGTWRSGVNTFWFSDSDLWVDFPDAVVVALPTAYPLTRDQAAGCIRVKSQCLIDNATSPLGRVAYAAARPRTAHVAEHHVDGE